MLGKYTDANDYENVNNNHSLRLVGEKQITPPSSYGFALFTMPHSILIVKKRDGCMLGMFMKQINGVCRVGFGQWLHLYELLPKIAK